MAAVDDDEFSGTCPDCGAGDGQPHAPSCDDTYERRRAREEREDEIAADFIDGWWPR